MDTSVRASGTPLPPWREQSYMLSNWFPEAAEDTPFSFSFRTPQMAPVA
jgi:hypothetical protein